MSNLIERYKLLELGKSDKSFRDYILELCRRDPIYWFNHFCWTFNPRKKPYNFPFILYPFQEEMVREIVTCIEEGEPILLKKSRDMGATWIVLGVFYWFWLFYEGSDFFLTSKTQDDVDRKGVKSTLFAKLRYLHKKLPSWMVPTLSREDDGFCKLVNPWNENSISGGAPTVDLGRSQRYKGAMLDEFAKLPYAQASYDSINQSTDCIVMPYTPYGKATAAYNMQQGKDVERIVLTKPEAA